MREKLFLFLYFIWYHCKNSTGVILVYFGLCVLGWIAYKNIEATSVFHALNYYNLIALFDMRYVVGEYHLSAVFGRLISYPVLLSVYLLCILGILVYLLNRRSDDRAAFVQRKSDAKFKFSYARIIGMGKCRGELLKLMVVQRGYIVLVAAGLVLLCLFPKIYDDLNADTAVFYRGYIERIEGKYTDKTQNYLQREKDKIAKSEQMLASGNVSAEAGSVLRQYIEKKKALYQACAYADYVQSVPGASIVYSRGYMAFFGRYHRQRNVLPFDVLAVAVMVVLSVLSWNTDTETGMLQLIVTYSGGKETVRKERKKVLLLCSFLIVLVVNGVFVYRLSAGFGAFNLHAQLNSLEAFSGVAGGIKVWQMFGIVLLLKWLYLFLLGNLTEYINRLCPNRQMSIVVMLFLGFFPMILYSL